MTKKEENSVVFKRETALSGKNISKRLDLQLLKIGAAALLILEGCLFSQLISLHQIFRKPLLIFCSLTLGEYSLVCKISVNSSWALYLRCCRYFQWISKAKNREGSNTAVWASQHSLLMSINWGGEGLIESFVCYTSPLLQLSTLNFFQFKTQKDKSRSNGMLRESRGGALFALLGASQV